MAQILIIDDDFDFADLTRRRVERMGFDVKVHVGARGAMDQLLHGSFTLVILDVKMPDFDGPAVIQMIRTLGTGHTKVMFYSSSDSHELRRLAEQHGAQSYLNKNATTDELEFRLRQLLGAPAAERKVTANAARGPAWSSLAPAQVNRIERRSTGSPARARVPNTSAPPTSRQRGEGRKR
jgi:DNA-binding response OmpR family regulator